VTGVLSDGPWSSRRVTPLASCVLAHNPSPMTLEGTNTWVLGAPGAAECAVVDPGPDEPTHRAEVLDEVRRREARVGVILLTHGHADHAQGAPTFAESAASGGRTPPVLALDPALHLGSEGLGDGDVISVGEVDVRVVATPGHSADSLCFLVDGPDSGGPAVLTGDTVLGRGTTVVAYPDGRLGPYLDSLDRLAVVCAVSGAVLLLPGHGPVLDDPVAVLAGYREHRLERLKQVAAAMRAGARTAEEVVEVVYADVDRALWPAATMSVRAQLEYLGGLA
jgi:glyoxylase-like metal-dependent hydrolase (beta-lactamase superfamily II)